MENLVPRLIGEPEAKRLGVKDGWYGTKMSGTFMTGPSASLEACMKAIDLVPEPPKVIDSNPAQALPADNQRAQSIHMLANAQARTAYNIGRKPYR